MGCFGTSGFLSRLPILSGQRVVCFIASVYSIFANEVDLWCLRSSVKTLKFPQNGIMPRMYNFIFLLTNELFFYK